MIDVLNLKASDTIIILLYENIVYNTCNVCNRCKIAMAKTLLFS